MSHTPGKFELLMAGVEALYGRVRDAARAAEPDYDRLRVYRWEPYGQIELPCICTAMPQPSPAQWKDVSGHRRRDDYRLEARIYVRWTDSDERHKRLEFYADIFTDLVDKEFRGREALGVAKEADRPTLQLIREQIGEVPCLGVAFPMQLSVDRFLTPTQ